MGRPVHLHLDSSPQRGMKRRGGRGRGRRGAGMQGGSSQKERLTLPTVSDMLFCFATTETTVVAIGKDGSRFGRELNAAIARFLGDKKKKTLPDFASILNYVSKRFAGLESDTLGANKKVTTVAQQPSFLSTLRGPIYFTPLE